MEYTGNLLYGQVLHRALPAGDLAQKLSARVESEEFGTRVGTEGLLSDILCVLQRIDTRMNRQDERLNTLETSIESEEFQGARSHWPAFGVVQSLQSRIGQGPGNQYENSIMKMKYEFDDDVSSLDVPTSEIEITPASKNDKVEDHLSESLDVEKRDTDTYSLSVYTDIMLDSNRIRVPGPSAFERSRLSDIPGSPDDISDANDTPNTSSCDVASRPSSEDSRKTASSGRSKAPHERAELAFYAYDNWKHGILSKIRNDSRAVQRKEMKRLQELKGPRETGQWRPWKLLVSMVKSVVQSNVSDLLFGGQRGGSDRKMVTLIC